MLSWQRHIATGLVLSANDHMRATASTPAPLSPSAWLQGLWTAVYGPHGREVSLMQQHGPGHMVPGLTADVTFSALKLIGDPNVPAGRHTFVRCQGQEVRVGLWDSLLRDMRPMAVFDPFLQFVTLEGPIASLRCWGQINRDPAR